MSKKVRVCSRASLAPGEMRAVEVAGLPPLAAFNVSGRFYVTSNVCTHNVAILTDGFFEGETIECPLHGGCFNVRTGEPLHFPCEVALPTYPVSVEGDDVLIEIKDD